MEDYNAKVDEAFKQLNSDGIPCVIKVIDGVRTIYVDDLSALWTRARKEYELVNK